MGRSTGEEQSEVGTLVAKGTHEVTSREDILRTRHNSHLVWEALSTLRWGYEKSTVPSLPCNTGYPIHVASQEN